MPKPNATNKVSLYLMMLNSIPTYQFYNELGHHASHQEACDYLASTVDAVDPKDESHYKEYQECRKGREVTFVPPTTSRWIVSDMPIYMK